MESGKKIKRKSLFLFVLYMVITNAIGYIELFRGYENAWYQVWTNYLAIGLSSFMFMFIWKFNSPSKINRMDLLEIFINGLFVLPIVGTGFVFFYSYLIEDLQFSGFLLSLFSFIPALLLWFYAFVMLGEKGGDVMRTIVLSDPHGCFDRMVALLEKVKYDKYKDRLFVLGDLVDRGYKSKEVVQYLLQMSESYDVQVVGGNHDDFFTYWLSDPEEGFPEYTELDPEKDYIGGIHTINSFLQNKDYRNHSDVRSFINEHYAEEVQFLRTLPNYIEEESYVFVHAGINPFLADWKNSTRKDFRYARNQFFWYDHEHPQTFVFGHTVTAKLHGGDKTNFGIWVDNKKIGIDGGCVGGNQLNALMITEEGYTWDFVKGGRS